MEEEFLNRFYSTQHTISMIELTNTKQWKDEPVLDYINRCYALSLEYKDWLSKVSTVEMCIQSTAWDLLYVLQMSKPWIIANRRDNSFSVVESKKDRAEFEKNAKFSKSSTKEVMTISKIAPVRITEEPNP